MKKIYLLIILLNLSCVSLIKSGQNEYDITRYFIGTANTSTFQNVINEILKHHGYEIENYYQNSTSSTIITSWKVRKVKNKEIALGYSKAKTKIEISGLMIDKSYMKKGPFEYECYMKVYDMVYDGKKYIESDYPNEVRRRMSFLAKIIRREFSKNSKNI
tara:strand:- start:7 stop:486 length:480 start_codon:yes stop_codon:yes gene_type:complete